MSDLVERLRSTDYGIPDDGPILNEAADEIERLKALSASQQSELEAIYAIIKCRCEGEAVNEIEFLQAENAAQLAELHAIDVALGTNEGHSAVHWIEVLQAKCMGLELSNKELRTLRQCDIDDLTAELKSEKRSSRTLQTIHEQSLQEVLRLNKVLQKYEPGRPMMITTEMK
jgi:hypothetical protein